MNKSAGSPFFLLKRQLHTSLLVKYRQDWFTTESSAMLDICNLSYIEKRTKEEIQGRQLKEGTKLNNKHMKVPKKRRKKEGRKKRRGRKKDD
jgi:hypothetical protein